MRVLVTGGAGYIGTHTMLEILAADYTPLVVDNFANSSPVALERVTRLSNRKFDHAEASLTDAPDGSLRITPCPEAAAPDTPHPAPLHP